MVYIIKIVFCDIDGTLSKRGVISKKNKELIKEFTKNDKMFILVTGRTVKYAVEISKSVGASKYVICCNGSIIYDYESNKIIYKQVIKYDDMKKLFEIVNKHNSRIVIGGIDKTFSNKPNYLKDETLIDDVTEAFYNSTPVVQVTISHKDKGVINDIISEVKNIDTLKVINKHRSLYDKNYKEDGNIWIDVAPKNVNKGLAVATLLKHLNIELKNSVRIGDDLNDMSMFFDEGINVAVENAIKELKEKADFITLPCDKDGVAVILDRIIRENL